MKKLVLLSLATMIAVSSFATVPSSKSDTGKMKMHKKHKMKKMKDTAAKM